jgi:hypothetical protein
MIGRYGNMNFKIEHAGLGWQYYSSFLTTPDKLKVKGVELFHKRLGYCTLVAIGSKRSILVKPVAGKPQWVMKNATGVKRMQMGHIK